MENRIRSHPHNVSLYQISMTKKKNPALNIKDIKRSHIRRYGKPLKGTSRVVVITPDMIVADFNMERDYWTTENKVGGTI